MSAVQTRALGAALLAEPHHDGSDATCSSGPTGSAARRRRPAARPAGDARRQGRAALRRTTASRAGRGELDEETATDDVVGARLPGRRTRSCRYRWLLCGRRRRLRLAERARRRPPRRARRRRLRQMPTGGRARTGTCALGRLRDLPRPLRDHRRGVEPPAVGRCRWRWDDLPDRARRQEPVRAASAATCAGSRRISTTSSELGVDALYLTPIFPAGTSHRYDATSFGRIDPLLGGDEALALARARRPRARACGVIGDLTLNHSGSGHEWFERAREPTRARPSAVFYFFDESLPHGYASWYGLPHLPKLNWALGRARPTGSLGVVRHWLEPDGLDGWRIDVANMAGRYRGVDLTHDLARAVREAATAAKPDALLDRRARARLPRRPARRRLARDDELRGLHAPGLVVAARRGRLRRSMREHFWGYPGRAACASAASRRSRR